MLHALKTWPEFYKEIVDGSKKFEIRLNDRPFKVGDEVVLQEYNPETKAYTGRETKREIGYMVSGCFGLKRGWVCFSLVEPF